jgi:2-polyprenyl-3-methyl-5-hydroxy-6-metoxy-1,4-benzoquinol methylase
LDGGQVVRSENAAKTHHQKSKELVRLVESLDHVSSTLDFGCGKLRYLDEISATTDHLFVTDSDVQLNRQQRLLDQTTSIVELARGSNKWSALSLKHLYAEHFRFDRIFCLNVLQIIPSPRLRRSILRRLRARLKPAGELVVVVQYRNSDFARMSKLPNARRYRDGMVLTFSRGVSFYAFIKPARLAQMIAAAGLKVAHCHVHDGSCYIIATPSQVMSESATKT